MRRKNFSKKKGILYHFKIGHKIVHSGKTNDLARRKQEHKVEWQGGHIFQVGNRTTEEAAREWEKNQKKS